MSDDYERVLLVKPDVFIYRIPPRTSNRGYRASDWKLDEPDWTGRLRLVTKGKECLLKLEEKTSGQLFAQCPIDAYPGVAVEAVSDSSRYFVLKIVSDAGKSAFIGIGFSDRGDSFDLNVALSDYFKQVQVEKDIEATDSKEDIQPKLDLKFKEGQTIKVNLNISKKSSGKAKTSRSGSGGSGSGGSGSGGSGILLPPPGSIKLPPPSTSVAATNAVKSESEMLKEFDLLCDKVQKTELKNDSASGTSSSNLSNWAQF